MSRPSSTGTEAPSSFQIEASSSSPTEASSSDDIDASASHKCPTILRFSVQLEAAGIQPTTDTPSELTPQRKSNKICWKLHDYSLGVFRTFGRPKNKKNLVCAFCYKDVVEYRFSCNTCAAHFCTFQCFGTHHSPDGIPFCSWVRNASLLHDTPPEQSYRAILVDCQGYFAYIWLKASFDKTNGTLSFETDCEEIIDYVNGTDYPRIRCLNINASPEAATKFAYGLDVITFNSSETHARQSKWMNKLSTLMDRNAPGLICPMFGPAIIFAYDVVKDQQSAKDKTFGAFISGRHAAFKETKPFANVIFTNKGRPGWSKGTSNASHALRVSDTGHQLMQALGVKSQLEEIFADPTTLLPTARPLYALFRAFYLGLRWYIRSSQPFHQPEDAQPSADYGKIFETFEYTIQNSSDPFRLRRIKMVGSFQIFQVNGGNIKPDHVRAMTQYFSSVSDTDESPSENGFRKYWEQYKEERKGTDINRIDSPYSLETDECGFDSKSAKMRKDIQQVSQHVTVEIAESNKKNMTEFPLMYVLDKEGWLGVWTPGKGYDFVRNSDEEEQMCADNWSRLIKKD